MSSSEVTSWRSIQCFSAVKHGLEVRRSIPKNGRDNLDRVRTGEHRFDSVVGVRDAAGDDQRRSHSPVENRRPAQPEEQFSARRQLHTRNRLHRFGVDVGLIEAVEEDDRGRAGAFETAGDVAECGKERRDLHGDRDLDVLC